MALRWVEGFETHSNFQQLTRKYATSSGGLGTDPGRVFGIAAEPVSLVLVTPSFGTDNTAIVGIGVKMLQHFAAVGNSAQGWYLETGSAEQCHLEMESTSGTGFRFHLYRGATLIDTTAYTDFGTWVYLEMNITVRDGVNGAYEIRLDGVVDSSGSGLNMADNGTDGWDVFAQRWSTTLSTRLAYDDIYVCDGTGAKNNDFLGPSVVEGVEVDLEGTTIEWAPASGVNNANMVDDPGGSNPVDINNHNGSDTDTEKDLFTYTDLQEITGTIHGIQIGTQMAMAAAGTRTVKTVYRDPDTTEADGASHVVSATSYDEFTEVFDDNPASAAAWDVADIDGGEFGYEVVS